MSTLGKTTVVKGDVHAAEELRIDGAVEGRVVCEHQAVVFGETARITGDVIARDVTVFGQINGQIVATDVVDVRAGAVVTGQALSPRFILDPDAFFRGRVEPQHVEAALRVAKFDEEAMTRRTFLWVGTLAVSYASAQHGIGAEQGATARRTAVTVYKDPNCGCCTLWGKHMEQAGFALSYVNSPDLAAVRSKYRVPASLQSCHTAIAEGYVVEGHVPAADVRRLLATKPKVAGIAVPGMPIGSPGMEQGSQKQSYAVMSFDAAGKTAVFAEH